MLVTLCLLVACPFQALGPSVPLPETGGRYRVSDRKVTIDEAHELARLAGGHLLELADEAEELAVRRAFGHEPFWLGLEYPREVWASGAPVKYTHWGEGEPSHQDGASFTIAGGDETKGAWDDVRGSTERFRAVIELDGEVDGEVDGEADAGPVRLARADLPARGVLLAVVEGLTQRDFENGFLAGWRGRGTLTTLAAEADPLACWGLATEGVSGAKSRLVSGGEPPAYVWFPNVLALLEELRSELHTAWLFDDPELSRLLASGARTDVRVSERGEPQERAYEELVNQAAPMVVVLGRTLATKKGERERSLKGVESEVRIFVTAREMDPRRKSEAWLVAVVGLPARSPKAREAGGKKGAAAESTEVPLFLLGVHHVASAPPPDATLADLVPTVIDHLGLVPGLGWGLDGLAFGRPVPAPGLELLVNGGAEHLRTQREFPGPIPGWTSSGEIGTEVYLRRNFERDGPGPGTRGTNLFQEWSEGEAWIEQTVDLANLAPKIDAQAFAVELSGWLGARAPTDRKATLVCEALGDKEKVLEHAEVEVGTSELRAELGAEKGVVRSGLVERRLVLDLPAKTRRVRVRLLFHGRGASYCGADELSLVLRER